MKKSISAHSNHLKTAKKKEEEAVPKANSKDESEKIHGKGRSSINSIPPPKIEAMYVAALSRPDDTSVDNNNNKKDDEGNGECEKLRNELCSAYRFVVNYGVFEPNFEWLPHEVTSFSHDIELKLEL